MKVPSKKVLFVVFAVLGVALQGCGCNEQGMNDCLSAGSVGGCTVLEEAAKCIPNNGCCDFEQSVEGVKMTGKNVAALTAEMCGFTNPCP